MPCLLARGLRQPQGSKLRPFCLCLPSRPAPGKNTCQMSAWLKYPTPQQTFDSRVQAVLPSQYAPARGTSIRPSYPFDSSSIKQNSSGLPNPNSPCLSVKKCERPSGDQTMTAPTLPQPAQINLPNRKRPKRRNCRIMFISLGSPCRVPNTAVRTIKHTRTNYRLLVLVERGRGGKVAVRWEVI